MYAKEFLGLCDELGNELTPHVLAESRYLGVCVVQKPGAWTRMGPTWRHPEIGWVCLGPGVHQWNTKLGLAELAASEEVAPSWHATAFSMCEKPNLAFAVARAVSGHHEEVARLRDIVERRFIEPRPVGDSRLG